MMATLTRIPALNRLWTYSSRSILCVGTLAPIVNVSRFQGKSIGDLKFLAFFGQCVITRIFVKQPKL